MEEKKYVALLHKIGFTQKQLFELFSEASEFFGKYQEFYSQVNYAFLQKLGYRESLIEHILELYKKYGLSYVEKTLDSRSVQILTYYDTNYPDEFKQMSSPPFVLYLRGVIPSRQKISFIGTRKMTDYGKNAIEKLIPSVGQYFDIVSGGAYGCDTKSHQASLENSIATLSIIGTGIDQDYPTGNKKLYDSIVQKGGGVLSMFALGEPGNPYNFPIRNELVAAISLGIVVIESQIKSGTLITVQLGLDLGKDIFAVPGEIGKLNSQGCNKLIQGGSAKLTTSGDDILCEYNIVGNSHSQKNKVSFSDKIEQGIYNLLLSQDMTIDELCMELDIDLKTIIFKMSMMEIQGIVNKGAGGKFQIC